MAIVSIFDQDMIERALTSEKLNFVKQDQNNYLLNFEYDDERGCEIHVLLSIDGQQNEIFAMRAFTDREIPKTQWAEIIMLCNTWNKMSRWPKAYLNADDTDTIGTIMLEEQIDLSKGIHDGLLLDYINTVLVSAFQFYKWMHQEKGF